MQELSLETIVIIAQAKLILFVYFVCAAIAIVRRAKPSMHAVIATGAIVSFYGVLAGPLKTMWWGNAGDENFILAFLSSVSQDSPFRDYYYAWLPPFYPPLYFWLTGFFGRFLASSSVGIAKVGVAATLAIWFVVPYAVQWRFWRRRLGGDRILRSSWLWFLSPLAFLFLVDFDAIITKPYEAFSALLCVVFLIVIAEALGDERWKRGRYALFGAAAGLLFLTFYFWWLIIAATLVWYSRVLHVPRQALRRCVVIAVVALVVASPYLVPLLFSYAQFGIENWQGRFFVPGDLSTFAPWFSVSVRGIVALLGVAGLIVGARSRGGMRVALYALIMCYVYQFANIASIALGDTPILPSKPFLFLGSALLSLGAAYLAVNGAGELAARLSLTRQRAAMLLCLLFVAPSLPFGSFLDDPVTRIQIEKDLRPSPGGDIAAALVDAVPDWRDRTWLSSAAPVFAPYVPLSYYVGYSPHYSHPAAQYSRRIRELREMADAKNPGEFMKVINAGSPKSIDAAVLYRDEAQGVYPIFLWEDAYPNGGRPMQVEIPMQLVIDEDWKTVYQDDGWVIVVTRKE